MSHLRAGLTTLATTCNVLREHRRRNGLNDPTGQARQVVNQSYEFVLENIGQDRDSGQIWHDYIQFLKTGPGQIGGNSWQDQQKVDVLRKAYQRAICIPIPNLHSLWREYDQFEQSLNKATVSGNHRIVDGKKFINPYNRLESSSRSDRLRT